MNFARTPIASTLVLVIAALLPVLCVAEPALHFVTASADDFDHPHDLILDPQDKYLFVADMDNDTIKVLEPLTLEVVHVIGLGQLRSPHDVEFDAQGRLLVADSGHSRIVAYKINGKNAEYDGVIVKGLSSPEGLVLDDSNQIYIANTGRHNLIVADLEGSIVKRFGGPGRESGQFVRPHDVALSSDGILFISDPGNNRIQMLDKSLNVVKILQGASYSFDEPKYLYLDKNDRLYVADQHNSTLKVYNAQQHFILQVNEYHIDGKKQYLNKPEGVTSSGEYVWVSDTYNNRIVLYSWSE